MPWYSEKIGPLPAGVWLGVVVAGVGGGLLWSRRRASAGPEVSTGADTGTGEVQSPLVPAALGALPGGISVQGPATNEEWVAQATALLTDQGHPADVVEVALTHYIQGASLTAAETVYKNLAVALIGYPPLPLPRPAPAPTPIPVPSPTPTAGHHYEVQFHRISSKTNARSLEYRFSDPPVSTPNNIETALRRTVSDGRNARYLPYYIKTHGYWPASAALHVTVIKTGAVRAA